LSPREWDFAAVCDLDCVKIGLGHVRHVPVKGQGCSLAWRGDVREAARVKVADTDDTSSGCSNGDCGTDDDVSLTVII
jgi:hypothetical protein